MKSVASTTNLSRGGALLTIDPQSARPGDIVQLVLGVAGAELTLTAYVVWVARQTGTMGVQFRNMNATLEMRLLELVEKNPPAVDGAPSMAHV